MTASPLSFDELGSMETAAGRGQIHLELPHNVVLPPQPVLTRLAGGGSLVSIAFKMQSDVHPPLYFLTLRAWLDLFGDSDAACRSLSTVFDLIAILLIFDIGRQLGSPAVGLWSAALRAFAQPQIVESQDARPYTLAIALTLAAWAILIRIEKRPTAARSILLALAILASALTHYYAAGVFIAMLLYVALRFRGPALRQTLAAFSCATLAGILLWLPGLLRQMRQPTFNGHWMYWFADSAPGHVTRTLARFAQLPLRYLADPVTTSAWLLTGGAVLYVLPFLLFRRRPGLLLCGLWLVCAAAMPAAIDLFHQTSQIDAIKYTLLASPAVYLMLPMLLKSPHWIGIVALACAAVALPDAHHDSEDPWRAIAADVNKIPPRQPLIIDGGSWGNWYGGMLFMGTQRYARQMPRATLILDQPQLPHGLQRQWSHQPLWLLAAPGCDVQTLLPAHHAVQIWHFVGCDLFQLAPRSD